MRGNGTQESPYIITTWSELEELSERYYDHENAYIAFDPDADNKVIDMMENPVVKTIKLYCWHILGNGWTIRNMHSSVSIFKPEDALRISYVSDLNFEDFFLDGSAGTVYFTNDTAAFSGDWDRGNCKWTGCTFSGELVGDAYFTNNHWANSSSVRERPMLDRCTLNIKCDDNSGFGRASDELFLRDTKLTIITKKPAYFKLENSKLTGNYTSLNVGGSTSVIDADVDELSGSGSLILVNSDRCSVPEGFAAVTGNQLNDAEYVENLGFPVGSEQKWQFINGELTNILFPAEKISGAFMNARNLEYAYIPRSCKKIGEWAFTNTKLRRVKIADDCEYYPTSFPPGCEIEFYGGGGEFGQLYDSEGYAIIDADGARIYVKE